MPIWHRHSDALVELSLSSKSDDQQARNWGLRLEDKTIDLRTFDGGWYVRERVLIEREGTKILRILVDGVAVYERP